MVKIAEIRATPVRVPVTRTGAFSRARRTHVSRTIVEVETTNGLVGLGETRGEWSAPIINDRFAGPMTGGGIGIESALEICLPERFDYGFPELLLDRTAFAGIELALWDLAGKIQGVPIYRLLGGPARDMAKFTAYAYAVDPTDGDNPVDVPRKMAEIADRSIANSGASIFEYKVGLWPLDCELAVLEAVRKAIGFQPGIAIDANMAYSLREAKKFADGAEGFGLENFEEPVAGLAQLEQFREATNLQVSTHCYDLEALVAYPAIDAVVSDLHSLGGLAKSLEKADEVVASGRRFWLRSCWELGISWAAMCHLVMAHPAFDRPSQSLIDWIEDDLTLGEPWLVRNGGVSPPDLPGLGIELDRDAFQRYAVA